VDCACALAGCCCGGVLRSYLWTAHAHWQAAAAVMVGGEGQDGGPTGQDAPLLPLPTALDPLVPPPGQNLFKFCFYLSPKFSMLLKSPVFKSQHLLTQLSLRSCR
jgi:hypothetical protein